jgi:flagellar hook-associated protein 2
MVTITTSTDSSSASLNGLSTGIDTTALIKAIMAQKSTNVNRLKAQQTLNNQKNTALVSLSGELMALTTSLAVLQDRFNASTVTSTDSSNAYVTATATGVSSGSFDIQVSTVASKARLSAKLDGSGNTTNLAVANPADATGSGIFTAGTPATFALQGTDGKVYTITLDSSSNTLNGLRDKINAVAGSSVTASVVNTGKGAKPYQLVITAKASGTGSTSGNVTLADVTSNDGVTVANNLGISAGTVNNLSTPTTLAGGLTSAAGNGAVATNANFTVNGISLTRSTNTITDAVDGMTFTLKQGGQSGTTTLTVGQDVTGTTAALQDYITKYNQLLKDYKTASTATKNADGTIAQAPLSGDQTTRALMANLRATLAGASAGLSGSATYQSLASVGVTNQADGTLYLNTYNFQKAMNADPASVQSLFSFSGSSTSPAATVKSGGPSTATGSVDFAITDTGGGNLVGTLTQNGVTSDPIPVTNGVLVGTGSYAGLNLTVTGTGTGTLTLSRGAGQAASDLLSTYTGLTGNIANLMNTITAQNANLAPQITRAQTLLDNEAANLKQKFAKMESIVGQMKVTSSSLFGA